MMGLGALFDRSTQYVATNTETGDTSTFTIIDNVAPDWASDGYRGGMGIPGAWRAALLLSDLLGGVPWHAYEEQAPGDEASAQRVSPTPPLLEQPAPPETRMTTFSSWALDLIWHGNAIGIIAARSPLGVPEAVVPVPADQVGVRRIAPWMDSGLPVGELEYWAGGRTFAARDVIHVKGPCQPGALRGMGVLEAHLATLNLAREQTRQASSLSQHGVPTGLLKSQNPDLTPGEATTLKTSWLTSQRDRTIAVLNATTDFTALSWNPEELQLVEARKFTLHELALIFGLDPSWLGAATSSRVYANIEQEGLTMVRFSAFAGHLARFEQTLSLAFPRGTTALANLDALLRADTLGRYQAHEIGLRAGFLTADEVRTMESRPPLTVEQRALIAARRPSTSPDPAPALTGEDPR